MKSLSFSEASFRMQSEMDRVKWMVHLLESLLCATHAFAQEVEVKALGEYSMTLKVRIMSWS